MPLQLVDINWQSSPLHLQGAPCAVPFTPFLANPPTFSAWASALCRSRARRSADQDLVVAIHCYIVVLEMFLWQKPVGRRAFGLTPELAHQTHALAANQGLYNGFLACVLVAGIFGGRRVSR